LECTDEILIQISRETAPFYFATNFNKKFKNVLVNFGPISSIIATDKWNKMAQK
jgi:hypothetical protein